MNSALFSSFLVWYVVLLFSTTLHEAMHSYVSKWGGDGTAHSQATLNPIPHIQRSPFGIVVVPILTFILSKGNSLIGWASAPFNPYWAARYPKRAFLMSLAGPLSHVPMIVVSFVAMVIGLRTGYFSGFQELGGMFMYPVSPNQPGNICWALALLCDVAFRLNCLLFFFNLIPLPPLDGSEVWYLFVKSEEDRLRYRMMSASYSIAGLMLAWYVLNNYYGYVEAFSVHMLYGLAR